jgi:hypothetical protein
MGAFESKADARQHPLGLRPGGAVGNQTSNHRALGSSMSERLIARRDLPHHYRGI